MATPALSPQIPTMSVDSMPAETAPAAATKDGALRSDQACAVLRQHILSCQIQPGSILTEAAVTERYQIGKATCRVALQRLAQEGFVRSIPRQGYVVTPITLKDVEEVFALRMQLEPMAARLAAGQVDVNLLEQLERACRNDDVSLEITSRIGNFLDANTAFHIAIAESSGNQRLVRTLVGLLNEMARLVALGFGVQQAKPEIKHDHKSLIEALGHGDGKRAEQIARQHVETFRDMTMEKVLASLKDTHGAAPIMPMRVVSQ